MAQASGQQARIVSATPARVITNSYSLTWNPPHQHIWQYDVVITPPPPAPNRREIELNTRKGLEVFDRLQTAYPQYFTPKVPFDGMKNIWSARQINFPALPMMFEIPWFAPRPPRAGQAPRPPRMARVTIQFAATVNVSTIRQGFQRPGPTGKDATWVANYNQALTTINALNVLLNTGPNMAWSKSKVFYVQEGSRAVGAFELRRGYFQSVRPRPGNLTVNVDIATGIMIRSENLRRVAQLFLNVNDLRNLELQKLHRLRGFLKGVHVRITLGGETRPQKVIKDVVDNVGSAMFTLNGVNLTVQQYFHQAYPNVHFPYANEPGVKIGKNGLYPLSVCEVVPDQLYKKALPPGEEFRTELLRFATQRPAQRRSFIESGLSNMHYQNSPFVPSYGVEVNTSMLEIGARLLSPPQLVFGNREVHTIPANNRGRWDVKGRRTFQDPRSIRAWAVVNFTRMTLQEVEGFAKSLNNAMVQRGISVPPGGPLLLNGSGAAPANVLSGFTRLQPDGRPFLADKQPYLIVAILPAIALEIYTAVKQFGDIMHGVATQCVNEGKRRAGSFNDQYLNNLCLKINAKLGGTNFIVNPSDRTMYHFAQLNSMAVGLDVSHPETTTRPSVAGLVSSIDMAASKYVATLRVQRPRQERIEELEAMMDFALRSYHEWTKPDLNPALAKAGKMRQILPSRIIVYRDGLSEGEYDTVATAELGAVRAACQKVFEEFKEQSRPEVTFIIVGKRHHVRFFPRAHEADRTGNCQSGLLVDEEIVHPIDADFYLQSQNGLLGTSRPSHYIVKEAGGLQLEFLKVLSYNLCHLYNRATTSVSIPAPVYYADLLCARGAKLHLKPNQPYETEGVTPDGNIDLDYFSDNFAKFAFGGMQRSMFFV